MNKTAVCCLRTMVFFLFKLLEISSPFSENLVCPDYTNHKNGSVCKDEYYQVFLSYFSTQARKSHSIPSFVMPGLSVSSVRLLEYAPVFTHDAASLVSDLSLSLISSSPLLPHNSLPLPHHYNSPSQLPLCSAIS